MASTTVLIERTAPSEQSKKTGDIELPPGNSPTHGTTEQGGIINRCGAFGRRGYTVRPTALPLEGISSPGQEDQSAVSNFHALRIPYKFDTDGISSPNWSPPAREETSFALDEGPHLQIHRVTCNDFPATWQPARRIVTFMGLVSLVCTLLVVAIILIAVALSRGTVTSQSRIGVGGPPELVHLIPQPRRFHNRTPTIVVHRQSPKIWRRHAEDLKALLKAYKDRQATATNCDLHYAPIGVSSCSFPLDRISENCTTQNQFGYETGNPCVALVFNTFIGWSPKPINGSDLPVELRTPDQDPQLLRVSCNAPTFDVRYSPYPGFPSRFLSGHASNLPPLIMVQFIGSGAPADVEVVCTLWAKNLPKNEDGRIRFSLYIV